MDDADAQLIRRAVRADPVASRQIVDRYARSLFRTCLSVLGDPQLAEDAVQDAFILAFRNLAQFDGRSPFEAWLRRIARNAALAIVRRDQAARAHAAPRDDEAGVDVVDEQPGVDPLRRAAGDEFRARLDAALGALSPAERTAYLLRHVEQRSLAEIADALGSNANAIKQTLFRGLRKLRAVLSPLHEEVP